ncbi:integrase core domain-containing protein [uncultured Roseobacter sp.]|uniref:integrase core domain-containing protein n=1 Tax=uncultured Roseobacter sp. TaxID=114847 RepID=UPI002609C032|nr:integrase core domain-containing protein [uncultured Roseobacter sp.]
MARTIRVCRPVLAHVDRPADLQALAFKELSVCAASDPIGSRHRIARKERRKTGIGSVSHEVMTEGCRWRSCGRGREFARRLLNQGIFLKNVGLHFLSPGKPTDKAAIEVFNSRLRQEHLNLSCFPSMGDADTQIND